MATNSLLIKIIILYFGINLMLYAGGVRTWDESGSLASIAGSTNSSAAFGDSNVQYYVNASTPIGVNGTVDVSQQTTNGNTLSFIDVIRSTSSFINFLGVLFAGVFIAFSPFPAAIQLFVGVPMGILFLIGIIYFTRSGQ